MGCYAALPALRVATGLLFNPHNGGLPRADILHTELCSLHLNPQDHSPEQLVVQSLFADGHIRYSMTLDERPGIEAPRPAFEALATHEEVIPDSIEDMTWVLSECGFRMTLSREAPDKIAAALPGFLERLLESAGENPQARRDQIIFAILFVTKDEPVHSKHCHSGEHWLHAALFILHPLVLISAGLLWYAWGQQPLSFIRYTGFEREFLLVNTLLTLAFGLYQLIYWNFLWSSATSQKQARLITPSTVN
jgi:hypothetical protein